MIGIGKPWLYSTTLKRTVPPHLIDPNLPTQHARLKPLIGVTEAPANPVTGKRV